MVDNIDIEVKSGAILPPGTAQLSLSQLKQAGKMLAEAAKNKPQKEVDREIAASLMQKR